mgnify:CR=1 FL=1
MIRLIGVSIHDCKTINEYREQLSFEEENQTFKLSKTQELINELNSKYGKKIFKTARELK